MTIPARANPATGDFPDYAADNRQNWETNACWWDDHIGDGNDFQTLLIEPATDRLLDAVPTDTVLDIACGAGRMTRRIAARGARVVAFDACAAFIERARERTPPDAAIEYAVLDAARADALLTLGTNRFDKAVCTMALMDMADIGPLFTALPRLLTAGGSFVFSILHPCFVSAPNTRVAEIEDDPSGRGVLRSAVKVSGYLTPSARRTEGISGQPVPQWCFHRPLSTLFGLGLAAGLAVDGFEEPRLPEVAARSGLSWSDMPDIPAILVVRMTLGRSRPG